MGPATPLVRAVVATEILSLGRIRALNFESFLVAIFSHKLPPSYWIENILPAQKQKSSTIFLFKLGYLHGLVYIL